MMPLLNVFQYQPGDEFSVVLHEIDPAGAYDFALSHGAGEDKLVAYAGDGRPLARSDVGHGVS